MNRNTLLLTLFSLLCFNISAQKHKILYQQLPLEDSVIQIDLKQVSTPYEVISWSGHNVLIETHIEYQDAPFELMLADIKNGFYELINSEQNKILTLKSKPLVKSKNVTTGKDVTVNVLYKIYVPEEYKEVSKAQFALPNVTFLAEQPKKNDDNKLNK